MKRMLCLALSAMIVCTMCSVGLAEQTEQHQYTLEQVLMFSRHNMRAPLATKGSFAATATPHEWMQWSSEAGELTDLGLVQESAMGEYFRKYLISEGFMERNEIPGFGEVRFYANSYQRTIATAKAFATGLYPVANIDVEYHQKLGTMDDVFKPSLKFISDAYLEQVNAEMDALCDGKGLQGIVDGQAENIAVIEDVLDFADSEYAQQNGLTHLPTTETQITYELGEEPKMTGDFKNINSLSDALIAQYYEDPDDSTVAFGKKLTFAQWQQIGGILDAYNTVLFCLPSVSVNIMHLLLQEIYAELNTPDRKLTFLCGHDSDVQPLLTVLGATTDLTLEESRNLTPNTPIGCKIVLQKWQGADGVEYASLHLLYQDSEKLRNNELVSMANPPIWAELTLEGLEKNADGMYLYQDVLDRIEEGIEAFDALPTDDAENAAA